MKVQARQYKKVLVGIAWDVSLKPSDKALQSWYKYQVCNYSVEKDINQ